MFLTNKEASEAGFTNVAANGEFGNNYVVRGATNSNTTIWAWAQKDILEMAGNVGFRQNNGQVLLPQKKNKNKNMAVTRYYK